MNVAVVGATGSTGSLVVARALSRGHRVVAIARHPENLRTRHADLVARCADVLDVSALSKALEGVERVVSAVGIGTSKGSTVTYSLGVKNILLAMGDNGIGHLTVTSAAPAGPRAEQPMLERRVLMPILDRFFGATYRDMRVMESELANSNVSWVALRPPRLVDRPATGHYRVARTPLPRARSLTYGDLATALLDTLERRDLCRTAVYVAN